jgi:hypothetical protein
MGGKLTTDLRGVSVGVAVFLLTAISIYQNLGFYLYFPFLLVFWLYFKPFLRNFPLFRALFRASRLDPKWGNYDAPVFNRDAP